MQGREAFLQHKQAALVLHPGTVTDINMLTSPRQPQMEKRMCFHLWLPAEAAAAALQSLCPLLKGTTVQLLTGLIQQRCRQFI